MKRIKSLCPSPGNWVVVFATVEGGLWEEPVVCFALLACSEASDEWEEIHPVIGGQYSGGHLDYVDEDAQPDALGVYVRPLEQATRDELLALAKAAHAADSAKAAHAADSAKTAHAAEKP